MTDTDKINLLWEAMMMPRPRGNAFVVRIGGGAVAGNAGQQTKCDLATMGTAAANMGLSGGIMLEEMR